MTNRETSLAWNYHDLTKHSYWSVRTTAHFLDWDNQPSPFKIYPRIDPIPLPRDLLRTGVPALAAVVGAGQGDLDDAEVNLDRLASLLYYSTGVTKQKAYPGGTIYFRAAACAGALYPVETYVVTGGIQGLEAGVYHFNPGDFALRRLRGGDFRDALSIATAGEQQVDAAQVVLVYTAMSWRSSWKYRDRAYRYHFWDNGMILANALAVARSIGLPAGVVMGFQEAEVNKLLGVDGIQELALSMLAVGSGTKPEPAAPSLEYEELDLDVLPLSRERVEYESIYEMHARSSLVSGEEVLEWRGRLERAPAETAGELIELRPPAPDELPGSSIEEVIQRRASTRRFARKALPFAELSTIIDRATRGVPADFLPPAGIGLNDMYLIVNRVEGLEPGAYYYRADRRALELLKSGDFSDKASHLALDQDLAGDASASFFFMAALNPILERFGNRGYRAVQMEAGIIGGKIYLSSYALGRGATGLTFYDDEVTEFFSPHAAGKSCIFVVSIGIPGKRPIL